MRRTFIANFAFLSAIVVTFSIFAHPEEQPPVAPVTAATPATLPAPASTPEHPGVHHIPAPSVEAAEAIEDSSETGKMLPKHSGHWGYREDNAPGHWGTISPEFAQCALGKEQSPIDLRSSHLIVNETPTLSYAASPIAATNTTHTVQVAYARGSSLTIQGAQYELIQYHFHSPSEHTFDGKHWPIELHLVHKAADGRIAVIGVLMSVGDENEALAPLFTDLPREAHETVAIDARIDANALLPKKKTFFMYQGSLTTPPCAQRVTWLVMQTPTQLSAAQLAAFKQIFTRNNRPTQPLHGRKVRAGTFE